MSEHHWSQPPEAGLPLFETPETNRNAAYHSLELGKRQAEVLAVIRDRPGVSNADISLLLNIPINRVTGRVKELRDMDKVIHAGNKPDAATGKTVSVWKAKDTSYDDTMHGSSRYIDKYRGY